MEVVLIIAIIIMIVVSDSDFIDWCFCLFCFVLLTMIICVIICWNKYENNSETQLHAIEYVIVYPSLFIAIHHLLWVLLGIITEPFGAFPILVAISSVLFALFYLVCELSCANISDSRLKCCIILLSAAAFLVFSLFIFILVVVGQAFFSESLIAGVVQTLLILIIAWWFGYLDLGKAKQSQPGIPL